MAEVIQHVVFSEWLLSLNSIHLCFLHVFSWLDGSFLFSANIPFSGCTIVYLSIHLLKDILVASKFGLL